MTETIRVGGAAAYDVIVGNGLTPNVADLVAGASRVFVVADSNVASGAETVQAALADAGFDAHLRLLPEGEQAKSLDVAAGLWQDMGRLRMTRNDAVVAVGGGATTDVAGFAAATWLRGVRVVHMPTTLLSMVDAAIGGKTGINTEAGKNLVGAFHPPSGVLVDLDVLERLPQQEWVNGMAEVVKAGFIADPSILDLIEADTPAAVDPQGSSAEELIRRSIRVKADVVSADLRETGRREILNYGHTLAHAIERVERYTMPHGQAVSIGMVFVAKLSRLAGRLDVETATRHAAILAAVGLPVTYRRRTFDELLEAMRVDKKARGATLRFVVLDRLADPAIMSGPDEELLRAAFDELSAP